MTVSSLHLVVWTLMDVFHILPFIRHTQVNIRPIMSVHKLTL